MLGRMEREAAEKEAAEGRAKSSQGEKENSRHDLCDSKRG